MWRCPYPDCGREYDRPAKLEEHERSHTGEVRFAPATILLAAAFYTFASFFSSLSYIHVLIFWSMWATSGNASACVLISHFLAGDMAMRVFQRPYACDRPGCTKQFFR